MYTVCRYISPGKRAEVNTHQLSSIHSSNTHQVVSLASIHRVPLQQSISPTLRVEQFLRTSSFTEFGLHPSGEDSITPNTHFTRKSSLRNSIRKTLCKCLKGSRISYQRLREEKTEDSKAEDLQPQNTQSDSKTRQSQSTQSGPQATHQQSQTTQETGCDLLNCLRSAGSEEYIPQSLIAMDTSRRYRLFDMRFKKLRNRARLVVESRQDGSQYLSETGLGGSQTSEMLEMCTAGSEGTVQKLYQVYSGQVRVQVTFRHKSLSVEVGECRDLPGFRSRCFSTWMYMYSLCMAVLWQKRKSRINFG